MSKIYVQQKKAVPAQPARQAASAAVHTPSLTTGAGSGELGALMQAKFQQHFLDNQIPTAEAEADRIAASVSGARTPEEVKSQLGEKMGADFSNVTFHTDSSARGVADTMGARAYTSGNDVYFGSGGFDPGVAAHELVHTVQQGVVGSSMQTVSAPAGGVQMKPGGFFKKIGHGIASAGRAVKTIATFPFRMISALIGDSKKRKQDAAAAQERQAELAELDQYFPAHKAFDAVSAQSSQTKQKQTAQAGAYLQSQGIMGADASPGEFMNSAAWGRQFQGLYREGDDTRNTALNNLFTVGQNGFNPEVMNTTKDEEGNVISSTPKDEAFENLGTIMGPIIQQMMGLDLDNMGTDTNSVLSNYNTMNELSASANSAFDLRKALEGQNKDARYDAMLEGYGTTREALTARHVAIGNKLRQMNRSMGIVGGLSSGNNQVDENGVYHVNPAANPEYEALLNQRANAPKKKKKR